MIKVMELIPTLGTGGAETMIKDYAMLADPEKIELQVVVIDKHYDTHNEEILEEQNIKTTYLGEVLFGRGKQLNFIQKVLRRISRYYYFRKLVLQEKPDIIHVHLVFDKYLRILPLKKMNVSLVYTVHNIIGNYFSKDKGDKKKYWEYQECKRLIDKHGMTLVALHDSMNKELRDYFHTDRVVTINNGIQMERFSKELYNSAEIRTSLGFEKSDFVIGNVGRLHPQKNHDLIIDIFVKVLEIKNNAKLLLVGKGDLENVIRTRIKELNIEDKVLMLKNRPDIPELMSAMDVFLFPSKWEGYGNVLLEAQCMGLPCIISDKVPECVRVTNLVHVIPLEEPISQWVEAICNKAMANDVVAEISEYDMKNCIKKLERLYESLI